MARGPQVGVGFLLRSIVLTSERDWSIVEYLGIGNNHSDKGSQHHSFVTGKTEVLVVIIDPWGFET